MISTRDCLPVATPKRTVISWIRRALNTRQDGGALVEFALIAPLMMGLMGGMFSFGFAFFTYF